MANLYSVLPGLTPSSQEIIEAELVAKQILEGKYPDLDLREGTGLRDLVLRPTAYAFALLKKATDYYFAQNTLATVDDATPAEVVDDLLSNWFLTRNTGTQAVISARLYFARSKNVTLTSDIGFSPDNKLYFFPEASQAYPSGAMSYDAYANEWYLDVAMTAASTGVEYNLSEGSLLYFSTFDPYFLRAEINYLISESSPAETNSEFVTRASSAISTRNLVNIPSIDSRLLQVFNYLDEVTVVGAGDSDMVRDMARVYPRDFTPVTPTAVVVSGSSISFTIADHGFQTGQTVVLSNALPTSYNGSFTITASDLDTITLYVPSNPGYISVLPSITQGMSAVYIHNGGAVDVYCGKRLSTAVLQFTTNSNGVAEVYGPAYSIVRSAVSGGDLEDTIPVTLPVTLSSSVFSAVAKTLALVTTGSTLSMGSTIRLYGVEQYEVVQTLSCTGTTVTGTTTGDHGIPEGSILRIEGAVPSAYNGTYTVTSAQGNTFTYSVSSQISGPASGSLKAYNTQTLVDAALVSVSGTSATISLPNLWPSTISAFSGTLLVEKETPYEQFLPGNRDPQDVLLTVLEGTATVNLFNHGISAGRKVYLEGLVQPALRGYWRVQTVVNGSQFTLDVAASGVANVSNVADKVTYLENSKDFGFSSRQQVNLDFGNAYANQTVSFEVSSFRDVDGIQDYLEAPDNRVVCGDYLARGFNITLLDVDVVAYALTSFDTSTIQLAVEAYLASLPAGSIFVLSDLVSAMYTRGVTNIRTPVGVKYTRYTRDLAPPESGVILDYLDTNDKTNVFLLQGVTSTALPL